MSTQTEDRELTAVDYLEKAIGDLDHARQDATEELRAKLDSAISRAREALEQMRGSAEDRAEHVKERAEQRLTDWQHTLTEASEELKHDLGVRVVRAQGSEDALDALSGEIKKRKKELEAA